MSPDINSTKHTAPATMAMIIETATFFFPVEQTLESVRRTRYTEFYSTLFIWSL